jgi:hypothetical protein
MYHGVKSVQATKGHKLILQFDNDESRVFDVTPLLSTGRFCELSSPQEFGKVRVDFDTIAWENGLDLDPEYLYEHSKPLDGGHSITAEPAGTSTTTP